MGAEVRPKDMDAVFLTVGFSVHSDRCLRKAHVRLIAPLHTLVGPLSDEPTPRTDISVLFVHALTFKDVLGLGEAQLQRIAYGLPERFGLRPARAVEVLAASAFRLSYLAQPAYR